MLEVVFPLIILSLGLAVAYICSRHKSQKKKQIVWGITLIALVAPFFSWLIGGLYTTFGSVETTGWAEIIYPILIFPVICLVGIWCLIKGIFNKEQIS
ncbi:O-antigen/teichoic acid export membrane protein [Planomicrobium stackebrandtii]|uniref:O-antigen/teichoic acid export membrane protein n=1 Tax=Planomicrobium stackebrandtii TaxID=253160 RepID=A0ABU0GZ47_9BACL|nr:hypothetical protein [Planomicrobium stackebrandtii]MDQ0429832.1 O-antigen/teichoic acid export membrane protein [Planomicrobium stackebrandtii]